MVWSNVHQGTCRKMRSSHSWQRRVVHAEGRECGSVLLFVLFGCLGVAVVIQTLCAVVVCGERALTEEASGRRQLAERDDGLAIMRLGALETWEAGPWRILKTEPAVVSGQVTEIENGEGWVLQADVRLDPPLSGIATSAWLERGRDGVDLPLAAMVATSVGFSPERVSPWMRAEADVSGSGSGPGRATEPTGYVIDQPQSQLLGEGCSLVELTQPWNLDEGWRSLDATSAHLGPRVIVLSGEEGEMVGLPADLDGSIPESPFMVLAVGGADLDARGRGDLYGVLAVDEGSALLDGTILHGAVFAGGCVDFGDCGCLVSCRAILRWATDRSLERVRLAPGTRWEGTE